MMPRDPNSQTDVESRLSTSEANIDSLSRDVSALVTSVQRISDRLASVGQTSWGTLASWAAVIIGVVFGVGGIVGSSWTRDINRNEGAIKELWETRGRDVQSHLAREYERGKGDQRLDAAERGLVKLDVDLQREMRLVNDTTKAENSQTRAQLIEFDRRLQGEIRQSHDDLQGQIKQVGDDSKGRKAEMDDRYKSLNSRVDENDAYYREKISSHDVRLEAVKKNTDIQLKRGE